MPQSVVCVWLTYALVQYPRLRDPHSFPTRRSSDLLLQLAPGTPVLATTATANQRVTTDVAAQLGEIGRASCRESGEVARVGASAKEALCSPRWPRRERRQEKTPMSGE